MIIKNITLKNFYRYGPNEQKLDLTGTGITGIVGPNGFGKSTCIVDSLCFEGAYSEETNEELSELYLAFYRRLAVIVVVVPNNLLSIQAIV